MVSPRLFLNTFLGFLIFFNLSLPSSAPAAEVGYVPVGNARTKKSVLAIPSVQTPGPSGSSGSASSSGPVSPALAKTVLETLKNDLSFMDMFSLLGPAAYVENASKGITLGTFDFADWTSIGVEILAKSSLTVDAQKNVALKGHLYDTKAGKQLLSKTYLGPMTDVRTIAHSFANDIVQTLTDLPGIFLTKIAMSCDLSGKKEIYVMGFDGSDVKQVTHHRSISFAPAWSPDGNQIAYSLFTRHNGVKNIDLYEFNLTNTTVRLLSNRRGINSGAAYSPDGKQIAMTLSYGGNPDIYSLDPRTRTVKKLSHSLGFDVDPAWSPDGKNLAFVSSRTGIPMVFTMKADGTQPQRLTYAGRYNASPTWSPQNNKIGFAGWIDRSFDIFIMNPDGTHIERLTKDQGNNEDPFFSPDGNFVAFSSNRTGQKNIYVMNVDGTFVKRLTYGLGNCVAPKWSNPPVTGNSESQKK